jgi:uncharacterized protein (TIGR03067 family)
MRILRSGAFWVAAVGLVMLAGCKSAEQKEADKAEIDKLQGTWRVSSATEGDKGEDDEEGAKAGGAGDVYIIDKDLMTHKVGGQAVEWERITVDASKDPKTIDLLVVNEDGSRFTTKSTKPGSGKKKKPTTTTTDYRRLGVYKLDGDTLTVTLSSTNGKTRPASVDEKRFSTLTLKKVKDGKEDAKGDKKDKEDKKDEKKDKDEKKEDKKGKEDKKDKEEKKEEK